MFKINYHSFLNTPKYNKYDKQNKMSFTSQKSFLRTWNKENIDYNEYNLPMSTCDKNKYNVGPIIGSGSYATVRLGYDDLGNRVAIKVYLKKNLKDDQLANVTKEISIMRQLNSDLIVKLYDVFETETSVRL